MQAVGEVRGNRASLTMRPIEAEDLDDAIRLLRSGFPNDGEAFWRQRIERLQRVQDSGFGYFLIGQEGPAGLMLTIRSQRRMPDGSLRRVVNLSSWYIEKTYRRRSVSMLRELAKDEESILTGLTPASQIQRLSEAVGFTVWNTGMILASAIPFALMPARAGTRLLTLTEGSPLIPAEDADLLAWHEREGLLPAVMIEDGVAQALLFRIIRRKGASFAQLVFAPSRRAAIRNLPMLMRFLAKRGILFATIDADREICPTAALFRTGRPRFFRGHIDRDRLDYAFSELILFGVS